MGSAGFVAGLFFYFVVGKVVLNINNGFHWPNLCLFLVSGCVGLVVDAVLENFKNRRVAKDGVEETTSSGRRK